MLTYFATISIKPEFFAQAVSAVKAIVPPTRKEAGCLQFDVYSDPTKNQLFILEQWSDQNAFDFHHAQDYTSAVFAAYENWLVQAPMLQPLIRVA